MELKKKNGYTGIDILIVVVVLGMAAIFTLTNLSYAFKDNTEELYNNQIDLILKEAEKYGETMKESLSKEDAFVTVNELVTKKYMGSNAEGKVLDPRDNKKDLNDLRIKLTLTGGEVDAILSEGN